MYGVKCTVILAAWLTLCYGRVDISCDNWQDVTSETGQQHFTFDTNALHWTPDGDPIRVVLKTKETTDKRIHSFLLQAHNVMDEPVGKWRIDSNNFRKHRCVDDEDSLVNGDGMLPTHEVVAEWLPPSYLTTSPGEEIDFNAAVITRNSGQNVLMNGIRSLTLQYEPQEVAVPDTPAPGSDSGETASPGESTHSNEGTDEGLDHEAQVEQSYRKETEELLKHREEVEKEIEDEVAESEGDWVREREEERIQEEHDRDEEMMRYEQEMAEEEARRQESMLLEIRDKEEHDRLMAEQERNNSTPPTDDDDDDDQEIVVNEDENVVSDISVGVSIHVVCLTSLFVTILALMFF